MKGDPQHKASMQPYWPVRSQDDVAAQELHATALLHLVNLHIVTDALQEYMMCESQQWYIQSCLSMTLYELHLCRTSSSLSLSDPCLLHCHQVCLDRFFQISHDHLSNMKIEEDMRMT